MDRKAVLDVFIKHMKANIAGLEVERIDPANSVLTMGATSLDAMEIARSTMRELKIKVPAAELGKAKNIDQIVDLFHSKLPEKK